MPQSEPFAIGFAGSSTLQSAMPDKSFIALDEFGEIVRTVEQEPGRLIISILLTDETYAAFLDPPLEQVMTVRRINAAGYEEILFVGYVQTVTFDSRIVVQLVA